MWMKKTKQNKKPQHFVVTLASLKLSIPFNYTYIQATSQTGRTSTYDRITSGVQAFSYRISDAKTAWNVLYAEHVFEVVVATRLATSLCYLTCVLLYHSLKFFDCCI